MVKSMAIASYRDEPMRRGRAAGPRSYRACTRVRDKNTPYNSSNRKIALELIRRVLLPIQCAVKVLLQMWPMREHQNINNRLYNLLCIIHISALAGTPRSN